MLVPAHTASSSVSCGSASLAVPSRVLADTIGSWAEASEESDVCLGTSVVSASGVEEDFPTFFGTGDFVELSTAGDVSLSAIFESTGMKWTYGT